MGLLQVDRTEVSMAVATLIDTDVRLRDAVIRQLEWDPEVDARSLGVIASDGIVTLTGFVDDYATKLAAERAVKRIRGVRAVANDIVVRLRQLRTDEDIARDAAQAIANPPTLADHIQIVVHHGHITLTGQVDWLFQRELAERLVRHVRGVLGIHNHITIAARAGVVDVRRRIVSALHHHADVDARHIEVAVRNHTVTLSGTVHSWSEREAAEHAAGQAPGVTQVNNFLTVESAVGADSRVTCEDEIC
jgi:osmotically-inducible protein OsmY